MTTNVLEGQPTAAKPGDKGLAIGETDAHVFNCPSCARALSEGTSICPGCGARLIMGVLVRRAGAILALGFVLGLLAGGAAMASVINLSLSESAAAAAAAAVAVPSAVPSASVEPSASVYPTTEAGVPGVPAAAISALSGTAVVNGRITVDTETLSGTLARQHSTSIELARALRSLAADAALGIDLTVRMSTWTAARPVVSRLDAFYRTIADTARAGLRAPLSDAGSYRSAASVMLTALDGLQSVDAESRALAATIELELPPVTGPAANAGSSPVLPTTP